MLTGLGLVAGPADSGGICPTDGLHRQGFSGMSEIVLKSREEIEAMRHACRLAAQTLEEAAKMVKPGENTLAINDFVHEYTIKHHAIPAPLHYCGYPKSCCISINDVICHGIPSKNAVLRDGDIVNIDITSILDGWHGDVSATEYWSCHVGPSSAGGSSQLLPKEVKPSIWSKRRDDALRLELPKCGPRRGWAILARPFRRLPRGADFRWCAITSVMAWDANFTKNLRSPIMASVTRGCAFWRG